MRKWWINLLILLGIKQRCQGFDGPCYNEGHKRRQNTAYDDDSRNHVVMCDTCMKYNEEHWDEMWRDYNNSRL